MSGVRIGLLLLVLFLMWSIPIGCGESGLVGGECAAGFLECGGECVDVASSQEHCGACGNQCPRGVACRRGMCGGNGADPDPGDASTNGTANEGGSSGGAGGTGDAASAGAGSMLPPGFPEGAALLDDGGVLLPDGNVVPPDPCVPPYNTATHCGGCFQSCGGNSPYCSAVEGGFACVIACEAPLELCDDRCLDLAQDPDHCGRCGNACPTAICEMGQCVGANPGHVVLMCISFEQAAQSAPQTKLFGNALGLPLRSPLRILSYNRHASAAAQSGVTQAIAWTEPDSEVTELSDAAEVSAALDVAQFDVFVMFDQPLAPADLLGNLGDTWAEALAGYVAAGGVVLVLASASGSAQMGDFIVNAGLLGDLSSISDRTSSQLHVRSASDAMATGVLSPFLGLQRSCAFETADVQGPNFIFVVTDRSVSSGQVGTPVVIHRAGSQ